MVVTAGHKENWNRKARVRCCVNPIYVALLIILLGEALLFGDERVAAWGVLFWLYTFAVVVIYEEPTLREQFGEEYRTYCKNVPRWVPRVIPCKPSS